MGARSDNTSRVGPRSQSEIRLLNGHAATFYNSNLNEGKIGTNPYSGPFTCTGGTQTTYGDYTVQTFLTSGASVSYKHLTLPTILIL